MITPELLALEVASASPARVGSEESAGSASRAQGKRGEAVAGSDDVCQKRQSAAYVPTQEAGLRDATEGFQREHIRQIWQDCEGNWAEAARRLKVDRGNLYRQARRLGVI
ncbi:hypothetical protein [Cobetia crustatorum]|uniref:hypothetical protein n=1 Tax=Cobetia crustatorum TaxID=553385 RepID=UPI000557F3F6|nr:hypothetical protein [Cobetia crustatorum]